MLADESLVATCFVGSPDRLFALCQAGYAPVLTHALVGGGAVFPIVHTIVGQFGIALCDMMTDPVFGPYATRTTARGRLHAAWMVSRFPCFAPVATTRFRTA
jgi:hypothetical protein